MDLKLPPHLKFLHAGSPAKKCDIKLTEKIVNWIFPAEFKSFSKKYNGAQPSLANLYLNNKKLFIDFFLAFGDDLRVFKTELNCKELLNHQQLLYHFNSDNIKGQPEKKFQLKKEEIITIVEIWNDLSTSLKPDLIPIASEINGGLFCYHIKKENSIYFWPGPEQKIQFVAKSLEELLSLLQ